PAHGPCPSRPPARPRASARQGVALRPRRTPGRPGQILASAGDVMTPRSFLFDQSGPIVRLTLNRPDTLHSLTFEVYRELTETLRALAARKDVRVVVLTGKGRAFCTGGDVNDIIGELLHRDRVGLLEFTRLTCDLVRAMRALPQPIVASLNGTVAGAGA